MSGGIGAALSRLVPPDRCFDYFVTADKVMPLRRAERKVRLRDLIYVKNCWDRAKAKEWERECILPSQSHFVRQLCSAADGNPLSASQTSPFQGSTRSESREDVFFKGVFKGELGRSFSFKDYFSVVRSIALKKV